jgi:hypothetical protein
MASFLNLDVNDAQEYKAVAEGEYQLRVMAAELKTSTKTGGEYIGLKLQIIGDDPFTKDVQHTLMIPTAKDDVKQANNRKLAIRNFMQAFDIEVTPQINVEDWVGKSGWVVLVEEHTEQYGDQNKLRRVIIKK